VVRKEAGWLLCYLFYPQHQASIEIAGTLTQPSSGFQIDAFADQQSHLAPE